MERQTSSSTLRLLRLGAALALLAGLLLIVPEALRPLLFWGLLALSLGAGLARILLRWAAEVRPPRALPPLQRRWLLLALLAWTPLVLQHLRPLRPLLRLDTDLQFAFWLAGALAVAAALGLRPRGPRPLRHKRHLLPLALLLALGFGLRTWQIEDSLRVYIDEVIFANTVTQFRLNPDRPLLNPLDFVSSVPAFYSYGQHWSVEMLGRSFRGLRLPSAYLGTLGIAAVYALGTAAFGRRVGWGAALLLTVWPAHLHFSRLGILQMGDVLAGTLALAALLRALRSGAARDYAWAGLFFGMTQYFYDGGRLLFPLLLALALAGLALRYGRRWAWGGVGRMLLGAALLAAPIYLAQLGYGIPPDNRWRFMRFPDAYWQQLFSGDGAALREHLTHTLETFAFYVVLPEEPFHAPYYGGQHALVHGPLLPLFVLGLGVALWRVRRPAGGLLIAWVALVALGSSLLWAHLLASRYVVALPALALLAALGLDALLRLLRWARWPYPLRALPALALLLLGASLTGYYFNEHLPYYNQQARGLDPDSTDAIYRSVDFPPGTYVHLISRPTIDYGYSRAELRFLRSNELVLRTPPRYKLTPAYLRKLPQNVDHAFFLRADDEIGFRLIREFFAVERIAFSTTPQLAPPQALVLVYVRAPQQKAPLSTEQGFSAIHED